MSIVPFIAPSEGPPWILRRPGFDIIHVKRDDLPILLYFVLSLVDLGE